jgi:hypothetical protein
MIKVFLILLAITGEFLHANQIILVLSDDFNSTKAKMFCFENGHKVFSDIDVNLGRNGLAWDKEDKKFLHVSLQPQKQEGDGKSPAGVFSLVSSFGYDNHEFSLPYLQTTSEDICIDDINSSLYNSIVKMPQAQPQSFEYMHRNDEQYRLGAVIDYNPFKIKKQGSCIFLHVQKELNHATSGCTSMSYDDLHKLLNWLDITKKPVLIQITKEYLKEAKKQYRDIPDIIESNMKE